MWCRSAPWHGEGRKHLEWGRLLDGPLHMLEVEKLAHIFLGITCLDDAKNILVKTKRRELGWTKNVGGCND